MKLISNADAKKAGLARFYTGKPCKYGHLSERAVSNWRCLECHKLMARKADKTRIYAALSRWYYRNQKLHIKRTNAWRTDPVARARRGFPVATRPKPERCESCGDAPGKHPMNLDHCHKTNKFRGWLCGLCNRGLGQFKDDIGRMKKAIVYLRRFNP